MRASNKNATRSLSMSDAMLFCSVTYITCPADPEKTLAIKLPFLILVIKNMKKYFTFEVQVNNISSVVSIRSFSLAMYIHPNFA